MYETILKHTRKIGETITVQEQVKTEQPLITCKACNGVGNVVLAERPYKCPACEGRGGKEQEPIYTMVDKEKLIVGISFKIGQAGYWHDDKNTVVYHIGGGDTIAEPLIK